MCQLVNVPMCQLKRGGNVPISQCANVPNEKGGVVIRPWSLVTRHFPPFHASRLDARNYES